MDHDSVRGMLSDYLDGAVSPADKVLIEEHLRECQECRTALAELEWIRLQLRSLGEVEPPPWLATRIMARVREEAVRETSLVRRFFLPLRWKLPIEAAALVFLTVTGYLVYRSVSPELTRVVPRVHEAGESAQPALPRTELRQEAAQEQSPATPAKGVAPASADSVKSSRKKDVRDTGAPSPAPEGNLTASAPSRQSVTETTGAGGERKAAEPETSRDYVVSIPLERGEALRQEREMMAPSSALRAKSSAVSAASEGRIDLAVADSESAAGMIEVLAKKLGGAVVQRDIHEGGGTMVVRIDGGRLGEFIDRLGQVGDLREKATAPSGVEGAYRIRIRLERIEGSKR